MRQKNERNIIRQKRISNPSSEKNPSEVTEVYWIFVHNNEIDYPAPTQQSGKWLVFVHKNQIDLVWKKIKFCIENGELGRSAKVSTARPNPNAQDPEKHVICVYTYNSDDVEDVRRIRQRLRELGITQKIPYKTDKATLEGKYAKRGHKKISKYFE
ncbi:MAG: putative phosphothreonine lyase domain-containing protein [Promethearchaeota archaeon]